VGWKVLNQILPQNYKKYARLGPELRVDFDYTISNVNPDISQVV
jgi:hypothetical protein